MQPILSFNTQQNATLVLTITTCLSKSLAASSPASPPIRPSARQRTCPTSPPRPSSDIPQQLRRLIPSPLKHVPAYFCVGPDRLLHTSTSWKGLIVLDTWDCHQISMRSDANHWARADNSFSCFQRRHERGNIFTTLRLNR